MDNLVGTPLIESLRYLQENSDKIIEIKKIKGTNSKFNKLDNLYVIKASCTGDYVTLFVAYY